MEVERRRALGLIAFVAAILATLVLTAPASAATRTWNLNVGPCFNGPWSTAVCWQGGIVPVTGDDAVISPIFGANPGNYDLGAGVVLHSITFNTSLAYAITGGPIALQSGGFITDNSSNSTADNLPSITLNGPATLTLGAVTNTLAFNGAVTGIGGLTVVNNATLDALRLNAVNTYSGATTIDGTARVVAAVNGSIPTSSALTVTATGSIDFQNESTIGSLAGEGLVNVNAPSLTAGGDNTNTTFSGILQGGPGAAFTKAGTGTLTLSGNASNTGMTTVNAGSLVLTGTMASPVTVNSGGTFAGTGSTLGNVTVNADGTLSPGTSIGALTAADVNFASGSNFEVELASGGVADRLNATGTVNLGGAELDLSLLGGYTHTPGTAFEIVASSNPITGTFAQSTVDVDGHRFRPDYATDPNKVFLVATRATPALTTAASAGITLGGQVSDTATLAGGDAPGGQITFRLYGPGDANCSGTPAFTDTKSVSGNGDYTSSDFTPTLAGAYRWVASYSGDADNQPSRAPATTRTRP